MRRAGGRENLAAGAATGVEPTAPGERLESIAIEILPLRLQVGRGGAADVGTLIPVEAHPAQISQLSFVVLRTHPATIEILHPQDEAAAGAPRLKPGEQRRARVAEVQVYGRAGGDAEAPALRPPVP